MFRAKGMKMDMIYKPVGNSDRQLCRLYFTFRYFFCSDAKKIHARALNLLFRHFDQPVTGDENKQLPEVRHWTIEKLQAGQTTLHFTR
jgi:hypothetical protein